MSRLERWIYRDLLDIYYDTEKPLPLDLDAVCYAVGASDDVERQAVERLLRFKFELTDSGYTHERCDSEIAAYHLKAETARENGKNGGRPPKAKGNPQEPKRKANGNQEKPSGFSSGSDSAASRDQQQTGFKTNQKPITKNQYVNPSGSGIANDSGRARDDESPPAAALIEALRKNGIDVDADDPRIESWLAVGATPPDVSTAVGKAHARRTKAGSSQPVSIGFIDTLLGDVLAARRAASGAPVASAGPWHRSWSGIVAYGRELDVAQEDGEPDADFKLRVFNAAGDGPWWAEHFPQTRGDGPVSVSAMLRGGHAT